MERASLKQQKLELFVIIFQCKIKIIHEIILSN